MKSWLSHLLNSLSGFNFLDFIANKLDMYLITWKGLYEWFVPAIYRGSFNNNKKKESLLWLMWSTCGSLNPILLKLRDIKLRFYCILYIALLSEIILAIQYFFWSVNSLLWCLFSFFLYFLACSFNYVHIFYYIKLYSSIFMGRTY